MPLKLIRTLYDARPWRRTSVMMPLIVTSIGKLRQLGKDAAPDSNIPIAHLQKSGSEAPSMT